MKIRIRLTLYRRDAINIAVTNQPNAFESSRRALRLRQIEVSRRTGISQSVISDLETGTNTNPTWEVLSKLATVYKKRADTFLPYAPLPTRRAS